MRTLPIGLARAEDSASAWLANHGVGVLRTNVGIVFFWFGVLKFFPALSPAEDLAGRTISALSFGARAVGRAPRGGGARAANAFTG